MAKLIAFTVEVNGLSKVIKNEEELAEAVKEVNEAYRAADYGSDARAQAVKELGKLKKLQADSRQEVRDSARDYQIAADAGNNSYRALNAQLVNLRREYKELSAAERNAAKGTDMLQHIQKLDEELKQLDAEMGQYQRNVGNYPSAFEGLADGLLNVAGLSLKALKDPIALATALGTAVIKVGEYVKDLTGEVQLLQSNVRTLTGSSGDELDAYTAKIRAISETYKVGTDDILRSANSLSKNIGISFDDALERLQTGLNKNLNINGELFDSLREYPGFFAEIFGEGEQAANVLFEAIRRGNEQGIYSDKALDSIKEFDIRIREMPQATQDALAAIGLDFEQVRKAIDEDGMGAALDLVTGKLQDVENDSQAMGQVLADVFGGAGEDANAKYVKNLFGISNATRLVIADGDALQKQREEAQRINEAYAAAEVQVAKAFGDTGANMDNLFTQGKTFLLQLLAPLITFFGDLGQALSPITDRLRDVAIQFGIMSADGKGTQRFVEDFTESLNELSEAVETVVGWIVQAEDFLNGLNDSVTNAGEATNSFFRDILGLGQAIDDLPAFGGGGAGGAWEDEAAGMNKLTQAQEEGRAAMEAYGKEQRKAITEAEKNFVSLAKLKAQLDQLTKDRDNAEVGSERFERLGKEIARVNKLIESYSLKQKKAAVETVNFAKGSVGYLQSQLSDLQKELKGATGDNRSSILEDIINVEAAIAKIEDAERRIRFQVATMDLGATEPVDVPVELQVPDNLSDQVRDALVDSLGKGLDDTAAFDKKLQEQLTRNFKIQKEQRKQDAIDEAEERAAIFQEAQATIFGGFNDINNALGQSIDSRAERELQTVEQRYSREIELAEGNDRRQEELRQQQAAEEDRIRKKQLEKQKKIRVASALAAMAEGIVNILATPSVIPDPFGAIFKGVRIATLTASTAIQIANIKRQQIAAKGISIPSLDEAVEVMAVGKLRDGWLTGPSHRHASKGIRLQLNGQTVMAEGEEFVDTDEFGNAIVINKRSAAAHRTLLSHTYGRTFAGKRELYSRINSERARGIPFMAQGGEVLPSMTSLAAYNAATGGGNVSAQLSQDAMERMAQVTRDAVFEGAKQGAAAGSYAGAKNGTADGAEDYNRRLERQARLNEKIG